MAAQFGGVRAPQAAATMERELGVLPGLDIGVAGQGQRASIFDC